VAIRGINVPICAPEVVAGSELKRAGSAIDSARGPFELEKGTHGRFIEVQMKLRKIERGPKFLVDKAGAETHGDDRTFELCGIVERQLTFEALFVSCGAGSPATLVGWSLGGEDCPAGTQFRAVKVGAGSSCAPRYWGLETQAEESASPAKGGLRRVVNGVVLENAALGCSTDSAESAQEGGQVADAQLDLDFAVGGPGHGTG